MKSIYIPVFYSNFLILKEAMVWVMCSYVTLAKYALYQL